MVEATPPTTTWNNLVNHLIVGTSILRSTLPCDIQQQDRPCPECGHNFTTMKPVKYQRQIVSRCCSVRGRGCGWSGMLGQLDVHLDHDQNNCQHVDIKCPLNCQQTILKNKLEQHMATECVKRDSVCQYCDFKATYEVMMDTHWPVCIYG